MITSNQLYSSEIQQHSKLFPCGRIKYYFVGVAKKTGLNFFTLKKKKKVVRIKQAIERDAHFWECPGSFIITERMACMIRHWALADSVGCDHTYKLTDTVPPTPFCQ